ncbi:hypothetical protein DERP_011578 [Dermatophagoides pteronyssinus]|uniref:Uncharacterized protein n=1 Tax=Dermatophagoides pteronyssinus TaxID=6956 RepID=A0ABQ8JWB0_DERPT|nr:hypothetical protein DERP_011578 [Dermatophagoides pteronyssinus]
MIRINPQSVKSLLDSVESIPKIIILGECLLGFVESRPQLESFTNILFIASVLWSIFSNLTFFLVSIRVFLYVDTSNSLLRNLLCNDIQDAEAEEVGKHKD